MPLRLIHIGFAAILCGTTPLYAAALFPVDAHRHVTPGVQILHRTGAAAIKCRYRNLPRLSTVENRVRAYRSRNRVGAALPPNLAANKRSARRQFRRCVAAEKRREQRKRLNY
ncbi:MAG: hypothetical protein ACR2O4_09680 [Hyphomicrobiaceae bacterium]